ncbi:hypothetical protein [Williamsia sp.]|uniref:hypothetical protein n=1 Tax=Williamsia sp. TaxID=1872085 RepID=UPI002F95F4EB
MNVRSIGSGIVGVVLAVAVLAACGDDLSTPSAPVSSSPTTGSGPATELVETSVPGPAVDGRTQPPAPAVPETSPPQISTPPIDDGPIDLLGNIAIWTSAGDEPLNGAAFDVQSCGQADDVGPVDMTGQSTIDVPVSVGCWIVTLTRTPDGYTLDGPPQRSMHLDAAVNEVDLTFRFLPLSPEMG